MWCDNCLLLLPLRAGAIAWGMIIFIYSAVGGVLLLKFGQFLFFTYPEWEIYGGISMVVALVAFINVLALSNRSYIWSRVCKFLWPFVIIISSVRAIVMMVRLHNGESEITWECDNGGQLWSASAAAGYGNGSTLPSGFCSSGFSSLQTAFIGALVVDLIFQLYMAFLNWRFSKRMEHYRDYKATAGAGGVGLYS